MEYIDTHWNTYTTKILIKKHTKEQEKFVKDGMQFCTAVKKVSFHSKKSL